jgi:hypothetical protein
MSIAPARIVLGREQKLAVSAQFAVTDAAQSNARRDSSAVQRPPAVSVGSQQRTLNPQARGLSLGAHTNSLCQKGFADRGGTQ